MVVFFFVSFAQPLTVILTRDLHVLYISFCGVYESDCGTLRLLYCMYLHPALEPPLKNFGMYVEGMSCA